MVLLVAALAMLGTASKLANARNIKLQGAVSGNANFDGSSNTIINTTQDNIAIVTGTVSLTEGKGNTTIKYPQGFNKSNTVILSFMAHNGTNVNGYGYGYLEGSNGYVAGALGHSINLADSDIKVSVQNPIAASSGSGTYQIKIVLFKTN